jgi:hypothetical protein
VQQLIDNIYFHKNVTNPSTGIEYYVHGSTAINIGIEGNRPHSRGSSHELGRCT